MQRVILALAVLIASALLSFRPVYEPDLGWHLAQGREDVSGRLVRTNVFSAAHPDYPQPYTSWLAEAGAYAAWRVGGDSGVQLAIAVLIGAALATLYAACRIAAPTSTTVGVLALAFVVIEARAIPRPHLVSFVGMAVCAWLVQRAIASRAIRPLLWTPLVVAIWSNAHGECIFGAALVGLFGASEWLAPSALTRRDARRVVAIAAVSVLAAMANPYGWGLFRYLIENATVPQLLAISELQPAYLPTYLAFFVYIGIAGLVLLAQGRRLVLWEVAALVLFAALGSRYLRLTPLVVFATAPMVAARLAAIGAAWRIDHRAIAISAIALASLVARVPVWTLVTGIRPGALHPAAVFSPGAVAFVREQGLNGPMFNSNNLGGWIAWTLYPSVRTFQDSRLQAYPAGHFARILDATRSQPAWDALVRDVDWAMLSSPRPNALSGVGRFSPAEWSTVFWDDAIEIVVRREGRYARMADEKGYKLLLPDAELRSLVQTLASAEADRLRAEAKRNRTENRESFLAAAVSCIDRDEAACADVERLAANRPGFQDDLALVRVLRGTR